MAPQAKTAPVADAKHIRQQAAVEEQLATMQAHSRDQSYDMTAAVLKLRKLGVLYPLDTYDARFPIIYATDDKAADKEHVKQALKAWQRGQK
jgi:hypothetical protein